MNGQRVVVRDVNGQSPIRFVVDSWAGTVFVASKTEYLRMQNGQSELSPVGFPSCDVFLYDGKPLKSPVNWKKLKPWVKSPTH